MPVSVARSEQVVRALVNRQESLPEPAALLKAPVPPVTVSVPWNRSLLLLPERPKVPSTRPPVEVQLEPANALKTDRPMTIPESIPVPAHVVLQTAAKRPAAPGKPESSPRVLTGCSLHGWLTGHSRALERE